jgi:hypothetical protein
MRLYKRGRVWWGWFYEGGERVSRSTGCHDKKAAESVVRRWERDAADPHHAATRQANLRQALGLLLKDREEQAHAGRKSHDTVQFYRAKAGHLVRVFETDLQGVHKPFLLSGLTPLPTSSPR